LLDNRSMFGVGIPRTSPPPLTPMPSTRRCQPVWSRHWFFWVGFRLYLANLSNLVFLS